jgi:hypothetical protein
MIRKIFGHLMKEIETRENYVMKNSTGVWNV